MQYPVELNIEYPGELSRLTTFFRVFMVIPHSIILYFLGIAASFIVFLSWWAILFTKKYPQSFFNFVTWFMRWNTRFSVYAFLMTDKYPPFSGDQSSITPPTGTNTITPTSGTIAT